MHSEKSDFNWKWYFFLIELSKSNACDIFRMAGLTFNKKMQGQLAARKYSSLMS